MKKILMILAVVGVMLFVGCGEKQITAEPEPEQTEQPADESKEPIKDNYPESLAGTVWKHKSQSDEAWVEFKLVFTDEQATYTVIGQIGDEEDIRSVIDYSYEYTYDYPEVVLDQGFTNNPVGKIEDDVLTIKIYETLDDAILLQLTKQ